MGKAQSTTSLESQLVSEGGIDTPVQEFYICFSGCGEYPLNYLCRKGFNHVSIMERVPLGFIVHDANKSALDTYVLPEAPAEDFIKIFLKSRPDYTILAVRKSVSNRDQHVVRFGVHSCVSIVAYILGLRLPFYCLTPYGLYKRLMRGGGGIISVRRLGYV